MATPPAASSSPSPSLPLPREGREWKGSDGKGRQRPDPQPHRRAAVPRGHPWRSERDTGLSPWSSGVSSRRSGVPGPYSLQGACRMVWQNGATSQHLLSRPHTVEPPACPSHR